MDQLMAMQVFVRVAESGSFSETARRLNQSKSAISKHVSALEDHLGAKLLYRTTRRVSLTEEGQAYVERAQRILDDLEEADQSVASLRAEPRGTLRVNSALSFGLRHIAPVLADFHRQYPQLTVDLDLNDRFVDLVEEGFDMAIRIGEMSDSSLIARRLGETHLIACSSPAYLAEMGRPERPADLADHRCLLYQGRRRASSTWTFYDTNDNEHTVRVNGPLIANNGDVLVTAALAGEGINLAPDFMCYEPLSNGDLVPVLPGYRGDSLPVSAVYPPNRHLSAKVRLFIDYLLERFTPVAPWQYPYQS